jgi:eukaryotic-like serine/threonine-protein kinase
MSLEGETLGRYHLESLIGRGGMSEVYLGTDTFINRRIAIKVIWAGPADSQTMRREMKAIIALDHPHILPLYDYSESRLQEKDIAYMVIPYRPEGSLASWLKKKVGTALLAPLEVAFLLNQAASALQHAHNRNIIHQDVKPSNFLIQASEENPARPHLLLADFGVARITTTANSFTDSILGTPAYMAPEQWQGHPVPATDQYALAVMAYVLLTGQQPFQGNANQIMYQHITNLPPPPSTINPSLPKEMDALLLQALSKEPGERFSSIAVFARTFQEAAQRTDAPGTSTVPAPQEAPPPVEQEADLYATLTITQIEAQSGTNRTLTLPGGKHMAVTIPPGAADGQVIRLGEAGGSTAGSLILTLAVQQQVEEEKYATADPEEATKTVLSPHVQTAERPEATDPEDAINTLPSLYRQTAERPETTDPEDAINTVFSSHRQIEEAPMSPMLPQLAGVVATLDLEAPVTSPSLSPDAPVTSPAVIIVPATGTLLSPAPAAAVGPRSATPETPLPPGRQSSRTRSPRRRGRLRTFVALALLIILVAGGVVGVLVIHSSQAVASIHATATARSITTQSNATATARIHATTTAWLDATATASIIAAHPYPSYLSNSLGSGKLVFYDPLEDDSYGHSWDVNEDCNFTGGFYHVSVTNPSTQPATYCVAHALDFADFAYQVQMTILKGDEGGIAFRASAENSSASYHVFISQSGYYFVQVCISNSHMYLCESLLQATFSAAILRGMKQVNQLTVGVKGTQIWLYVNGHLLTTLQDKADTYSHGQFGVLASSEGNHLTDVAYSNAEAWTF